MTPKRIQLSRAKGYRKPEGAIVVSRPSKWGNPFTVKGAKEAGWEFASDEYARRFVAECFDDWLTQGPQFEWWFEAGYERFIWISSHLEDLRGHNLACWCPEDSKWCHGETLLRMSSR